MNGQAKMNAALDTGINYEGIDLASGYPREVFHNIGSNLYPTSGEFPKMPSQASTYYGQNSWFGWNGRVIPDVRGASVRFVQFSLGFQRNPNQKILSSLKNVIQTFCMAIKTTGRT